MQHPRGGPVAGRGCLRGEKENMNNVWTSTKKIMCWYWLIDLASASYECRLQVRKETWFKGRDNYTFFLDQIFCKLKASKIKKICILVYVFLKKIPLNLYPIQPIQDVW